MSRQETFALLQTQPSSDDGLEPLVAAFRELLRPEHSVPMKVNLLFTKLVRAMWFTQQKKLAPRDQHCVLWQLLSDLITHDDFDPTGLDALRDETMKLVWDEYEHGQCKESARALLVTIAESSRLQPYFRHVLAKFCNARVSPSYCAALKACNNEERLMEPVMALLLDAVNRASELGVAVLSSVMISYLEDSELHARSNFLHLVKLGSIAYPIIAMAFFPPLSNEQTSQAARKRKVAVDEAYKMLTQAYAVSPDLVAPLFGYLVQWTTQKYDVEFCTDMTQRFQKMLGNVCHPDMAALVWASRTIPDQEFRRKWAWELVSVEMQRQANAVLSNVSLLTFAMAVRVEPTVAFQMVDMGIFVASVESGEGQTQLICELVNAYSLLRALHELLAFLVQLPFKETSLRNAYLDQPVRSIAQSCLRQCLPSVAKSLALVPRDRVSTQIVMDVLLWGPVGPEAAAAGWRPLKWGAKLCRIPQFSSEHGALLECFLNAAHYRWQPLLVQEMMQDRLKYGLIDTANDLQRIRFARDFPEHWVVPENAGEMCLRIMEGKESDAVEWGLLLWAGGMPILKLWLRNAPETSIMSTDANEAWTSGRRQQQEGMEAVSLATLDAIMEVTSLQRAQLLASAVPLQVLAMSSDATLAVTALARAEQWARLAELLCLQPSFHKAARRVWLHGKKLALGPAVAVVLNDDKVWKACFALPRPNVWGYLAAAEDCTRALKCLSSAGLDALSESGAWEVCSMALRLINLSQWVTLAASFWMPLFGRIWLASQWDTLMCYHQCLNRLDIQGASIAMRKSLQLLIHFQDSLDESVVSQLLTLADYEMAIHCALAASPRIFAEFLLLPASVHDTNTLKSFLPAILMRLLEWAPQEPLLAAQCSERLFRVVPPSDPNQMAMFLQPCLMAGSDVSPALIDASMRALGMARRACPSVWLRGAGIVAALEARAMGLLGRVPRNEEEYEMYVEAGRTVGREVGANGAQLKKRRHFLTFSLADYLTRCEPRASLGIRNAIWDEGLKYAMEAVVTTSEPQQKFSFDLVRGPVSNKAAWRRYKRRWEEMDQYQGHV